MKLVNILARSMAEWPTDNPLDVGQAADGDIHVPGRSARYIRHLGVKFPLADDWGSANVTRAQWQAAVDALKAAENTVPEWNGEGLPPVGMVCEYQDSLGRWDKVEITAVAKRGICFVQIAHDGENYVNKTEARFRPIRTPEQIAAEERDRSIDAMLKIAEGPHDGNPRKVHVSRPQIAALYDAGYRKFEIVDN